tara:strand:- start:2027 stop:2308 length:282 start_codon:yes stop_codon:yes gene_type:complete
MKKVIIIAAMLASVSGLAQNTQCISTTKKGDRCLLTVNANDLCWRHNPEYVKKEKNPTVVCSATTKLTLIVSRKLVTRVEFVITTDLKTNINN